MTERTVIRNTTNGITIPVGKEAYYVAANVLKGNDAVLCIVQQPWHCNHAEPGAYTGLLDFPFVVIFPLISGDNYRCNVVLPTRFFIGEITFKENDVLFMRGGTVQSGAASLFVRLYVQSDVAPRRVDNETFLVDDIMIESIMGDASTVEDSSEDSLFHNEFSHMKP